MPRPLLVTSSSRNTAQLNRSTEKKLFAYTALAGAGGIGLLGFAQPAQAEVVYTPAHQVIHRFGTIPLDLNGDGIVDFTFVAGSSRPGAKTFSTRTDASIVINEASGNRVWGHGGQTPYVSALAAGVKIGSNVKFAGTNVVMGRVSAVDGAAPVYSAPWAPKGGNVQNHYVGLKFLINGEVHYGWARLSVQIRPAEKSGIQAELTGYAYETVANKAIETGRTSGPEEASSQPATLGHLARGSAALAAWRREDKADVMN
jgi:hypothetical protein